MKLHRKILNKRMAAALGAFLLAGNVAAQDVGEADYILTLLHFNDGESDVVSSDGVGGAARFVNKIGMLQEEGNNITRPRGVLTLSSGDNFLAGPEFNASGALPSYQPYYDTQVITASDVDALALGNHEFDFGPDVLARVIRPLQRQPYLSANLDFTGEPALQNLVDRGKIAPSTVIEKGGEMIGVIGATTPRLPFISSPGNVTVDPDVAAAVQSEIDLLSSAGVDKIILISHLQGIDEDLALIPMLSGVDIAVAGGGDELLASEDDVLVPGDEEDVFGEYPLMAMGGDGAMVPVVTTSGSYNYVGRLVVGFDADGNLTGFDDGLSGPQRVVAATIGADGVGPDRTTLVAVDEPVRNSVAALAANVIGNSEVGLDGVRGNVRTTETNQGNLITDAFLFEATRRAPDFGAPAPDVALANGGGIRNDSMIPAGNITELDTFDMLPFSNFVVVVPGVPRTQFKEIMENAVSRVEFTDGRFAQIGGFTMMYDAAGTPQELDGDGNVTVAGTRVQSIMLDDATVIVDGGMVVDGPPINVTTINFSANGGDQYPFRGAPFTALGVSYQQALENYIVEGLGGTITAVDYPEGGEGRIVRDN